MAKYILSFLFIALGILGLTSASSAQTSRGANSSVVKVYGPDVLTDLVGQAILEKRPDAVVVRHDKALRNKVWVEGPTGSGYVPLSPKRVRLMQAARAGGGSVFAALCDEQKGVVQQATGIREGSRRVVRKEYREEYHVRAVSPPPAVYAPAVNVVVGGYYPFYGYGGYYGWWRDGRHHYYSGWGGHRYYNHGGHRPSGSYRH